MIKNNTNHNFSESLIDEMVSFLYMNNMILKKRDLSGVIHVPISIFPSHV